MLKYLARKPFLVNITTVFIIVAILDIIFSINNTIIRILIAAPIMAILMPRKKKIDTQTGIKTQITWFLLKEPILLDE